LIDASLPPGRKPARFAVRESGNPITILGAATVGGFFVGLLGKNDPETLPIAKR
jgi:hypothetical protein